MADTMITASRSCTKCGAAKDAAAFYKSKDAPGGLRTTCRDCDNAKRRARYVERADEIKAANRDSWRRHRDKRLAYDRQRNEARRDARHERAAREWEALTPDQKAQKAKRLREWKAANPDKVRAMWERTYRTHRERNIKRRAEWARKNPVAVAAIRSRRRAREAGAGGDHTKQDVQRLLNTQGRVCLYCGGRLTRFHVDHFIPLARGGSNGPDNLVLACPPCNFSKAAKLPWEFMPKRFSPPR